MSSLNACAWTRAGDSWSRSGAAGSRAITTRGPASGSGTISPGWSSSIGCRTTRSGRPGRYWRRGSRRTSRGGSCMGFEMALDFPRHLLELEALTRPRIEGLLSLAARFKRERARARGGEAQTDRRGLLRGRNVITLFFETSTRTRSSFEVAAKALGADVLTFQKDASSVAKGESLEDTVRNLGAHVRVGGPSTLIPSGIEKLGCTVARSLREALTGADAVMALRIQNERIADARLPGPRDYARTWGLNARRLEMLPKEALVLHPGPVNRGVEMSSDVLDSPRSLVMDQVDSGVAVRMAVLALCLRAEVPA